MTLINATPLRIASVPAGRNGGLVGLTFAPGKHAPSTFGGHHARDLDVDLDAVRDWGSAVLVTLMEDHELRSFKIEGIGEGVRRRFMEWHHMPIVDGQVAGPEFEAAWPELSARLRELVLSGNRIVVHCRGGLGRAGSVAARLLVEMGADPKEAIAAVRLARSPHAIENPWQEAWVAARTSPPTTGPDARDRAMGALLGLAVGDAVGTTIEFSPKPDAPVLFDMVGGGPFRLAPGQWTDDTSMALALVDSLIAAPSLDARDLMDRFVAWRDRGHYSCTGRCFDIGTTVAAALRRYEETGDPIAGSDDPKSAGNGAIMRLAPVALRHWRNRAELVRVARAQSRTTHAAPEAVAYAAILADILADAISGRPLSEILSSPAAMEVRDFRVGQPRDEVRGSGYVVASLHAALWSVSRTTSFESAVLTAANLGQDADTTAAIAGQIAGALYGASGIPPAWLERLAWRDEIRNKAEALFDAGLRPSPEEAASPHPSR